jgi:type IX secretion system PorP/SprF family membrane protein
LLINEFVIYLPPIKNTDVQATRMRSLFKILILIILVTIEQSILAQQEPTYSQYMFNVFLLNPAAAGADGSTSISLTGREQWVGWPGTPKTHSLSAQTRVLKNSFIAKALSLRKKFSKRSSSGRIGLGVHVYNDINGPMVRSGLHLTYAYHIPLRQSQLSFGLSMMPYQFNILRSELTNLKNDDDPLINSIAPRYVVDGNLGAQFTTPLLFAGASVTDLFQSSIKFGDKSQAGYQIVRHYCLMGGYKIEINKLIMLEPTTLMKFTEQGTFQMDITARAYYREDYWGGISYRTGANAGAIVFLTGMRLKRYYIGYAFDLTLSPIMKHTFGSHEFLFTLKLGDNARRYRWLNRY